MPIWADPHKLADSIIFKDFRDDKADLAQDIGGLACGQADGSILGFGLWDLKLRPVWEDRM